MMNIVTLEEVKAHARIDESAEDDILMLYAESAEETVLNLCNRTLEDLYDEYEKIPAAIRHAVLMLIAHSYNQRQPATMQNLYTVPYTLEALIKPYMIL